MVAADRTSVDRRTILRGLGGIGVLGLVATLPACTSSLEAARLTVATGSNQGVYFAVGTALGQVWQQHLGLTAAPVVRTSAGSGENLQLLASGAADVAFSQVDAAADLLRRTPPTDPRSPRALARVYDEFVHVVVPAGAPISTLTDLRGKRVSIGAVDSGVILVAKRLLRAAGVTDTDLDAKNFGLNDSIAALENGTIDAFFWAGGLPTRGIVDLAGRFPIKLIGLGDVTELIAAYPEYARNSLPAGTYRNLEPVRSVLIRSFLLVRAEMADDLAYALVEVLFGEQDRLAQASPSALTIDLQSGIGTSPVPLHPGAQRFFRQAKESGN